MIFPRSNPFDDPDAARRMVRYHGRWLTEALRQPGAMPRIPLRAVSRGGFAALLARPDGRDRAERWWEEALERVPL